MKHFFITKKSKKFNEKMWWNDLVLLQLFPFLHHLSAYQVYNKLVCYTKNIQNECFYSRSPNPEWRHHAFKAHMTPNTVIEFFFNSLIIHTSIFSRSNLQHFYCVCQYSEIWRKKFWKNISISLYDKSSLISGRVWNRFNRIYF